MKKILAISSSGGHWKQLSRLNSLFSEYEMIYVCTNDVSNQIGCSKFFKVKDANLNSKLPLLILALQVLYVVLIVRPNVVITTGAAPGFFAILFSKIFLNSKTIWIDSIANGKEPSTSGLKIKKWADLWLTQWPNVERKFGMKYSGELI